MSAGPDKLDRLSRELNGLSRDEITEIRGTAPAAVHMCPLCGGSGGVADEALMEYVRQLQIVDSIPRSSGDPSSV